MSALISFWQKEARDGRLPLRSSFRPEDFPKAIGDLALIEVTEGGEFLYRVTAGHVLNRVRLDRPLRTLSELEPPAYRDLVKQHFELVLAERIPVRHVIAYPTTDSEMIYERLILPFSREGERVDYLLCLSTLSDLEI